MKLDRVDFELINALSLASSQSEAAVILGLTESTVSQRLLRLESVVGTILYNRKTKNMTRVGERIAESSLIVLAGMKKLNSDIAAIINEHECVTIMTNQSIAIDDLPEALEQVKKRFCKVLFRVIDGTISESIDALLTNKVDAAIIYNVDQVKGLSLHHYRTDRLHLIVPSSHQLAALKQVSFAEAAQYPFIGTGAAHNLSTEMRNQAHRQKLSLKFSMHVNSYEVQSHYVGSTSLGIALALGNVARRVKTFLPVKIIPLSDDFAKGRYAIAVRENDCSEIAHHFIERMMLSESPITCVDNQ